MSAPELVPIIGARETCSEEGNTGPGPGSTARLLNACRVSGVSALGRRAAPGLTGEALASVRCPEVAVPGSLGVGRVAQAQVTPRPTCNPGWLPLARPAGGSHAAPPHTEHVTLISFSPPTAPTPRSCRTQRGAALPYSSVHCPKGGLSRFWTSLLRRRPPHSP